jgi:hypothetical protein
MSPIAADLAAGHDPLRFAPSASRTCGRRIDTVKKFSDDAAINDWRSTVVESSTVEACAPSSGGQDVLANR